MLLNILLGADDLIFFGGGVGMGDLSMAGISLQDRFFLSLEISLICLINIVYYALCSY